MTGIEEARRRVRECIENQETELNLSGLSLSDLDIQVPGIKKCLQVRKINLSNNQIENISILSNLINLTELDLSRNLIKEIDPLRKIKNLEILDLLWNNIQDFTPLSALTNLNSLAVFSSMIRNVSPLSSLSNLNQLALLWNRSEDLTALSFLGNLKVLDLSNNRDTNSLNGILRLSNLNELNLSNNHLSDLGSVSKLINVSELDLSRNQIKDLSLFADLERLKWVNLRQNLVKDFRPLLKNNSFRNGSLKIRINNERDERVSYVSQAVESGYNALKAFYDLEDAEGVVPNDFLKVIVLGNSTTGKTSLLKYLRFRKFDEREVTTHGISSIIDFELEPKSYKHVNFWDFGGQDYYHSTHRLFITPNSLCIILCHQDLENRREEEETIEYIEFIENGGVKQKAVPVRVRHYPYSYWLKTFAHLTKAKNADEKDWQKINKTKVFLIENKCFSRKAKNGMLLRKNEFQKDRFEIVKENFFHLDIKEAYLFHEKTKVTDSAEEYYHEFRKFERILKMELKKSFENNNFTVIANFPKIRCILAELAEDINANKLLENIGRLEKESKLPKNIEIEKLPVWITYAEYLAIIKQNSKVFNKHTVDFITTYLRDFCGRIMYFDNIESLKQIVFINPQWLHTRIYLFLNKDFVKEREIAWQGETLEMKRAEFILEEVDEKFEDDYLDALQLLDLMTAFELVFEIPHQNPRRFISPQYLSIECPLSPTQLNKNKTTYHKLALTLEFGQYLPPSLISRIISQKGHLVKNNDEPLWRNGVIYEENEQSIFLLCIPEENKIEFYLSSSEEGIQKKTMRDFMVFLEDKYSDELDELYLSLPNIEGKAKWKHLLRAKKGGGITAKNYDFSYERELVDSRPFEFLFEKFEKEAVRIFLCYSTKDSREKDILFKKLKPALDAFARNESIKIELFHDKEMPTGSDWLQTIRENIDSNDILICLLSNDFFNSQFIDLEEHGNILRDILAEKRNSVIAPIYLKDCQIKEGKHIANFNIWKPDPSEYGLEVSSANFSFNNLIGHANDSYIDNYVNGFVTSISGEVLEISRYK